MNYHLFQKFNSNNSEPPFYLNLVIRANSSKVIKKDITRIQTITTKIKLNRISNIDSLHSKFILAQTEITLEIVKLVLDSRENSRSRPNALITHSSPKIWHIIHKSLTGFVFILDSKIVLTTKIAKAKVTRFIINGIFTFNLDKQLHQEQLYQQ
ncbi:hypothetical protein ACTFIU_005687 [Dictyostelium citrinum]